MSPHHITVGLQYRYPVLVVPKLGSTGLCIELHRPFCVLPPSAARRKGQPMKTNENQKSTREYKVYIHRLKAWVEVTEEQYYAYYRDIWATRKRAQAHGRCMCSKSNTWMCDGDCLACEFRAAGDNLSLDYTVEDGEGNQKSWADDLVDDAPNVQSIMEDRELLCALYQKLQELDPEGCRICELIMEGKSERDIASIMGYNNQSAVNYRKQKAFDRLRVLLGDYI